MLNKNRLLIPIIIITCLLPFLIQAAGFELEEKYPVLPGMRETITPYSSLGDVIKYFSSFAILIAGLVVLISLIVAGLQYITSTGRPQVMSQARARVLNSFLGLAIILGSYLILVTVNPQLVVMKLVREPVKSGTVLLTEEGYDNLGSGSAKPLSQLLNEDNARFLEYSIKNCTSTFGELKQMTDSNGRPITRPDPNQQGVQLPVVNFENFPVYGLAMWQETQEGHYQVEIFQDKDFTTEIKDSPYPPYYYDALNESAIPGLKKAQIPFVTSTVVFKGLDGAMKTSRAVHPPLSIKRFFKGPGVYLYDSKDPASAKQKHITQPKEEFGDWNDETRYISIDNQGKRDYIVSLHDDSVYLGQLRFFFERKARPFVWNGTTFEEKDIKFGNLPTSTETETKLIPTDRIGPYGNLKKASSAFVAQLSPNPGDCAEVKICTSKYLKKKNFCILYQSKLNQAYTGMEAQLKAQDPEVVKILPMGSFDDANKKLSDENVLYTPANIRDGDEVGNTGDNKIKLCVWKKDNTKIVMPIRDETTGTAKCPTISGGEEVESKEIKVEFNNKITRLDIQGKCLVGLFENPITDKDKCWQEEYKKCWQHETPGTHSQVFLKTTDLTDHEICQCGFVTNNPCASAIVIFPLK